MTSIQGFILALFLHQLEIHLNIDIFGLHNAHSSLPRYDRI